ncbi:MAG TPA: GAF domain-containing protein [Ideonella sp.]|nr:GAF domain-containing protein [Ideonella sp.]
MKTFIKATEFWLPSPDRSQLEYGGGLYGEAARFGRVSRDMCFGRGEGLPGRAWQQGRPVVLNEFEGSYFKRTAAALADGLTCAIALPIFIGDYLGSVAVFFCGDDEAHAGAIELWHNDAQASRDMNLLDGHYGRTAETFEFVSRRTSYRRGTGLPGQAWEHGAPVFLPDLGRAAGSLRSDSAVKVGINRGFAMPCATPGDDTYVIAFLSALGTPIARRVEIWRPDAEAKYLRLDSGFCEAAGDLSWPPSGRVLAAGDGAPGRAWQTGVPAMSEHLASEPGIASLDVGLKSVAALPVLRQGRFVASVALYF